MSSYSQTQTENLAQQVQQVLYEILGDEAANAAVIFIRNALVYVAVLKPYQVGAVIEVLRLYPQIDMGRVHVTPMDDPTFTTEGYPEE